MRSIHGIETALKENFRSAPQPPSAPPGMYPHLDALNLQTNFNPHFQTPDASSMGVLIPMVKAIKSNQERYIPLIPMKHRPGRREVMEGKGDLIIALTSCGRYDVLKEVQDKDDFTTILARLKELVHDNDMDDLWNSYRR